MKKSRYYDLALVTIALMVAVMANTAFAGNGDLQITTEPHIRIFIDGNFIGVTTDVDEGLFVSNLLAGMHTLKAVKDDHSPYVEEILIQENKAVEVKVIFSNSDSNQINVDGAEGERAKLFANMVFVNGGCFDMGDIFGDGRDNERPVHQVCLKDYYIDIYEVSQNIYNDISGNNPSVNKKCGDNCPVENVSWHNASTYCAKVGKRLPTEAEWEYAARNEGLKEKYAGGDDLEGEAWYKKNSSNRIHMVGQKKPNGLGLYDMSGNVSEWVDDLYTGKYNTKALSLNIMPYRVIRGGSFSDKPEFVRTTFRSSMNPGNRLNYIGFRCALTP